jgi:hypothetical protein
LDQSSVDDEIAFIPGLELSRRLFVEAVEPLLQHRFGRLRLGAGHLGRGSDVLGFDTPQSRDHDWGPQVTLFVAEADYSAQLVADIDRVLADELPFEVAGYSTHFAAFPELGMTPEGDLADGGHPAPIAQRPIRHKVRITTVRRFCQNYLGVDPLASSGLAPAAWLSIPEQHLRTLAVGGVFRDDLGELWRARDILRWYPHEVWLYVLAAQWRRIEQEEPFMACCGDVGDELGSRVEATRLVRELMHLCFLMERSYAPYSKWFGTGFRQLACFDRLHPLLSGALDGRSWREREGYRSEVYTVVAELHNALGITDPLPTSVSRFHHRPYLVLGADRFWQAIEARISSPAVRRLPHHLGSISQWVDSTDVQAYPNWFGRLRALYEHG